MQTKWSRFHGIHLDSLTDWGHVTVEEALDPEKNDVFVYFASKLLAERALWQFVKEHPQLDVVASKSFRTSVS